MRDAPNFTVLHRRCPLCGSPLIRNRRGIECGEMHCEYADDSTIDRLTAENAKLRAVVEAAREVVDGAPEYAGGLETALAALEEK